MDTIKYTLSENQMPRAWYNISADLPTPAPRVLHPGTGQPISPADLAPLFPAELIKNASNMSIGTWFQGRDRYIKLSVVESATDREVWQIQYRYKLGARVRFEHNNQWSVATLLIMKYSFTILLLSVVTLLASCTL